VTRWQTRRTGSETDFGEAIAGDFNGDLSCILHTVDVTNLIAVVGRYRYLIDSITRIMQLHDDLCIERDPSEFRSKGKGAQDVDLECPIAGMKFRQVHASIMFSTPVKTRFSDEFVEWHPPLRAAPRSIIRDPITASHSSSSSGFTIAGSASGAYWPSPCSSTDDVKTRFVRQSISGFLVPAVAKISRVADDGNRRFDDALDTTCQLERESALWSFEDQNVGNLRAEILRDTVQNAASVHSALYATTMMPIFG